MGILDKYNDSDLNSLSEAEIESLKMLIWSEYQKDSPRVFANRGAVRIVSEGDSWFNYSFAGFDIIDYLADTDKFLIVRHATPGDTIENMVYGTDYKSNSFKILPPQLNEVLLDVEEYNPTFFLISGGGNDIAGPELESLLNHKSSGLQSLRSDHLKFLIDVIIKSTYRAMIEKVWSIDPSIHIITHGYAYAIPSGKGIGQILGFNFIGPWLRPALTRKRIVDPADQEQIISNLIDSFNEMLNELSSEYRNFHIVDLRLEFSRHDWANELHLTNAAYRRAAARFEEKIEAVSAADV